jgi:DNA-directed RNA polymerase subunit RPC12/RpoP
MNDLVKKFLESGGEIQQLDAGIKRDLNVCMNCKNLFPSAEMTKGSQRRCKKCHQRHTKFRTSR